MNGWEANSGSKMPDLVDLVLVFGGRELLSSPSTFVNLREHFPQGQLVTCSTAGEILGAHVQDDSLSATALGLENSKLQTNQIDLFAYTSHIEAGRDLARQFPFEELRLVLVLSDGHHVNVSELVQGLNEELGGQVPITGGLAGDGPRFEQTLVGLDEAPSEGKVVAIGFYGDALKVGHGSVGGWDPFGPERIITRSEGNVLYELDGNSALELYKNYLGDRAKDLPGSALLFPLSIWLEDRDDSVVRTVLSVDEASQSMTFAGDIPEGRRCRLMKANFDRLIDGSAAAAEKSLEGLKDFEPDLAVLVSCVGRKLILGQMVEDEVEEVRSILGPNVCLTGFYSYGELSPLGSNTGCELHNQTMTITTLSES